MENVMSTLWKSALIAAVAFGGVAVQSSGASAMPMVDVSPAVMAHAAGEANVQEAGWHGGWHRHHGWHRHYGWHRHHGWHRHYGWHRHWGWRHHRHW